MHGNTPVWVDFRFVRDQPLQYGMALPHRPRLYVIHNTHLPTQYYIGSTGNLHDRFQPRLAACNEVGLTQNDLTHIHVYTIEIWCRLDGQGPEQPSQGPGNEGRVVWRSLLIDVEHILIRTFLQGFGCQLRNTGKTGPYQHVVAIQGPLCWQLHDQAGIGVLGGHAFHQRWYQLAEWETL